jgi:tetratricopeptide (TPR) repeat protein
VTLTRALLGSGLLLGLFGANLISGQLNAFFLAFPGIDKVLHFGFHALLFPVLRALAASVSRTPTGRTRAAFAAGLVVAVSDEAVQSFWPSRSVELADVVADVCGLVFGWVLTVRPGRRLAIAASAASLFGASYLAYDTHVRLIDYSRGMRYERAHDFARAYDHYVAAYRNGMRSAELFNSLSWTRVESGKGDMQIAAEWGRQAHELEPESADILDTYGWALLHVGRPAEALTLLTAAYKKKPEMYCIHYHLGEAYRALGRHDEAVAHLERQTTLPGTREALFAKRALVEMERR